MRLVLTTGEPAGVGPELAVAAARWFADWRAGRVAAPDGMRVPAGTDLRLSLIGDAELLRSRGGEFAGLAGVDVEPVSLRMPAPAGQLVLANSDYVIETLDRAIALVDAGAADAIVTAPVHKGIINQAGLSFSGHTEYLQERAGVPRVVMMLVGGGLRVALVTTHLPLRAVPDAITGPLLAEIIHILDADLRKRFGIARPSIAVCGLNPHAGEGGYLGREEIEVIEPALAALRAEGIALHGPFPADTLFVPSIVAPYDAVLAMYHDQGLPVLKHASFGLGVNITLGLPYVRTSVDHGTALDLAGTGRADVGSLLQAISTAVAMVDPSLSSQS
ncbi:4-hydroxythreonine-4-phosphate dehydrogenase PdxA [Pigmentiphaga aceris]|uniref:4-hydroxythreonine-4-phosphate dehydrogenase n=1 Tax=Pigmentiphaga aceris TaxID=1940612 RepID=A0A5C0B2H7_9BURK|nr:4-hydroxythreonine-4-phosphate dehydrogenase PdxA [Pigmentiphaga aceris]QEI08126.1 4-hydroxythreonine-4-phosphate dehydrogenase PdxA [Pigmentiphaga aceris]